MNLIRPTAANLVGFGRLRSLAAVEKVLAHKLGSEYYKRWRLIGWGLVEEGSKSSDYEITILAERVTVLVK